MRVHLPWIERLAIPVRARVGAGLAFALDDEPLRTAGRDDVVAALGRTQPLLDRPAAPFELGAHRVGHIVLMEHTSKVRGFARPKRDPSNTR